MGGAMELGDGPPTPLAGPDNPLLSRLSLPNPPLGPLGGGPLMGGAMELGDGPPTPLAGPDNPDGGVALGIPLPAGRPNPCPPAPGIGILGAPGSVGGGPSTVIDTIFSPRSSISPNTLFSSRSLCLELLGLSFLNSSVSTNIK